MSKPFMLRYLSKSDVDACLSPVERRLELAELAMESLATGNAVMPPKPVLMTRADPRGEFHALPAYLAKEDLAGCKWSCTFAGNPPRGIPAVSATIILSDPDTGLPQAIMDGTVVTGHRTAAVSGVAIKRFAPSRVDKVAIWGAGFQARTHLLVLTAILPGLSLWVYDAKDAAVEDFAAWAKTQNGVAEVQRARDVAELLDGAGVVVTATTEHRSSDPFVTPERVAADCLLVPLEWELQVPASTVDQARQFLVDDREEFFYYRAMDTVDFTDYPDPDETLGEAIIRGANRVSRPSGLVISSALGTGAADVVAASDVLRNAEEAGIGTLLPL